MADNGFDLSQPGIEQLNKSLDKLVVSMTSLEKRLASIQKNSGTAFQRVFGSTKDFDAIIKSVNKLNSVGVDGLKVLTSSIKGLANSLADLPAKSPQQFFKNLTELLNTVNGAKFKNNPQLLEFFKTLNVAVKELSSLGTVTGTAPQSIRLISQVILTVARLAVDTSVAQITAAKINQVKNIENLIQVYKHIIEALGSIDRIAPNALVSLKNLSVFSRAFRDIGKGFELLSENVDSINLGSIVKLGFIIGRLSLIFRSITGLTQSSASLSGVALLSKVFEQIGFGLLAMTRAVDQINLKQIAKIGLVVLGISAAFQGVAKLLSALPGFEQLSKLSQIFSSLAGSLQFFTKFADNLNLLKTIVVTQKLKIFFQSLGGALASASNSVAKNQGLENLTKLSEIFARLGPAITSILKVAEKLPLFNPVKIIKQFLQINALVRTVSQIAGGLSKQANNLAKNNGLQNLDQLSVIFDRLGRGIRSLVGASAVISQAKLVNLSPVKALFSALDPLFKQLRKFKNATLPDFGKLFESLFNFAEKVTQESFDAKKLKGLKDFTKELANGLKELTKLRVNATNLNAISTLLDSLGNARDGLKALSSGGAGGAGGIGLPLGRELSDEVEEGFLSGQLKVKLFGILFAAFKALNPITLTKQFVDGLVQVFQKITALPGQFITKLKEAGTSLQSLGSSLKTSGLGLINSVGLGGIANNQLFQAAVGFDNLSTQVKNFGNLTDEQLKSAQAFSNEIGIKYPQSSNEALQATLNLLKAGLSLNDTFGALPAAADLSSISDTHDLDAASKAIILVTQSFKDFNEEAVGSFDNASVASDIIARSANNSTASVESLVEGLKNVAPIANAAGLSLEETTAILGLFSDAGLAGAEGGTQLKSLLTNLTRPTDSVRDELRKLGVQLEDTEGNFRPINDIINDLSKSMFEAKTVTVSFSKATAEQKPRLDAAQKAYAAAARQVLIYQDGLSTGALDQEKANKKIAELSKVQANAQKVIQEITGSQAETEKITTTITRGQFENFQSIQKLAGSFGQAGLNILLSQGQDAIKGFIEEMGRLPTAAEQAQLLLDNLSGDAQQLQGSMESLGTRAFLPLINRVFRPLVKIGRLVVDFFNSLPDPILETIVNAGVLVSIMATLAGGFLVAAGFVAQFSGIILTVLGTIGGLLINLPLVVATLAGFVGAFVSLVAIGAVLAPILLSVSAVITDFFRIIENNIGGAGEALGRVQETFSAIATTIGDIVSLGAGIFGTIFGDSLNETTVKRGERVAGFLSQINIALAGFKNKLNVVKTLFSGFTDFLKLGEGDQNLKDNIFDKLIAQGLPVGLAMEEADRQVNKTKDSLTKALQAISQSSIGEALFGKDLDITKVEAAFASIKKNLIQLKTGVLKVVGGIGGSIFGALGLSSPQDAKLAEQQLKQGLSQLGSLLSKGIQKLTGVNLSEAILFFSAGDLQSGAENLVKSVFDALKTAFFANQSKITDILSGIFNFLLPGKFVVPILRLFGLNDAADTLAKVFDDINKIFRNSLGFIFDLLKGKSLNEALFGNFGTAARPIARLIAAVGKAFSTLAGIFGDLFKALFPAGLSTGGSGNFIEDIINGISSALEFFTNFILQPIKTVLPAVIELVGKLGAVFVTVLSGLFSIVQKVAGPLVKLFSDLFSGKIDLSGFLSGIGPALTSTIQALITSLPALIGTLVSGLGQLFGSPLLNQIGAQLQTGDFTGAISTIASALFGVISQAISAIPALFTDLGTTLGSPLLIKIGEQLGQGDILGVISTITQTIADTISTAISDVPARLVELGTTLNLDFLKDLGLTIEKSTLLSGIVDTLGRLLALPFDVLTSVVDSFKEIGTSISTLAATDPARLAIIATVIGALVLVLAGPAIATGLAALAAAAAPVLLTIAGVVAILLLLKNGITAIADVISGKKNIFEGISEFFTGLASDALALIGVNITPEQIADQITTFFNSVNGILQIALSQLINSIKTAGQNIADTFSGSIDDFNARVDQAKGTAGSGFGDIFFGIQQSIKDNNFRAISEQLNLAAEKGLDLEPFKRLLRNNYTGIMESFQKDLPNLFSFAPEDFGAVMNTLVGANALDDAISQVPQDKLAEFYQKLFAVSPSLLTGLDFSTIQSQLGTALASGIFDLSQVSDFVLKLPNLTDAQKQAIIESFKTQIPPAEVPITVTTTTTPATEADKTRLKNDIGTSVTPTEPVNVPVEVKPTVTTTPPTVADTQAAKDQLTAGILPQGNEPLKVDLPVDIQAIADPATAQEFADALALVTTNAGLAQDAIVELQTNTNLVSTDLTAASGAVAQYAVDVDTNTSLAEGQWVEHSALVQPLLLGISISLGSIVQRFQAIGAEVEKANATYPKKLATISGLFAAFANGAIGPLDRLLGKLRDINFILQQVLVNLGGIQGTDVNALGSGAPPNRALGGSVFSGKLYEVAENGNSELLKIGTKTFLIPGQNGMVVPAGAFSPPPAAGGGVRNTTNSSNISISSPITVQVNAPAGADANGIGRAVAGQIAPLIEQNNMDVKRRLLLTGRT